uniref:Uncharacterized protein n=1 Tax=viral metagenome TaxID=1070528 RepID=A0A6C0EKQ3_9ZZZZ
MSNEQEIQGTQKENKPNFTPVELDTVAHVYTFTCPHCDMWTEVPVNQVNCHIFRHAFFFQQLPNGGMVLLNQLNPHAPKEVCDKLKEENKIVGCGKPFKFVRDGEKYRAEICDYIENFLFSF